jgi:hypothetical protein
MYIAYFCGKSSRYVPLPRYYQIVKSANYVECEIQSLHDVFFCICHKLFTVALLCVYRPMYINSINLVL